MIKLPVSIDVGALIRAIPAGSASTNWAIDFYYKALSFLDMIRTIDMFLEAIISTFNGLATIWKWTRVVDFEKSAF